MLWGRLFSSILGLQVGHRFVRARLLLAVDFWSKTGAVALAAFQEGVRQPMFWLLTIIGALTMVVSIVIPYFTFGEDTKMVKELTFALTMMSPAIFGVHHREHLRQRGDRGADRGDAPEQAGQAARFSLRQIHRHHAGGMLMTMFLGWVLVWVVLAKFHLRFHAGSRADPARPAWLTSWCASTFGQTVSGDLLLGVGLWISDTGDALPGLVIGFGQVMTLIAISVALATRLPMVVNCRPVPGDLLPGPPGADHDGSEPADPARPLLRPAVRVAAAGPGACSMSSPAIVREVPLDTGRYTIYTMNVALYALIYTAIAILAGLILFEDRDVA